MAGLSKACLVCCCCNDESESCEEDRLRLQVGTVLEEVRLRIRPKRDFFGGDCGAHVKGKD